MAAAETKTCPMCGEDIAAAARICRHCGEAIGAGLDDDEHRIREAAEKLVKERQDKSTALQIFLTGLVGCFAPIVAIYGTVFLLMRPEPFPRKTLAVIGTLLHWMWTALLVVLILMDNVDFFLVGGGP